MRVWNDILDSDDHWSCLARSFFCDEPDEQVAYLRGDLDHSQAHLLRLRHHAVVDQEWKDGYQLMVEEVAQPLQHKDPSQNPTVGEVNQVDVPKKKKRGRKPPAEIPDLDLDGMGDQEAAARKLVRFCLSRNVHLYTTAEGEICAVRFFSRLMENVAVMHQAFEKNAIPSSHELEAFLESFVHGPEEAVDGEDGDDPMDVEANSPGYRTEGSQGTV